LGVAVSVCLRCNEALFWAKSYITGLIFQEIKIAAGLLHFAILLGAANFR